MTERQTDFLGFIDNTLVTPQDAPEREKLREWASEYLDLGKLRDPLVDIRQSLRYDAENLPEELHLMIDMMEVLLTPPNAEQIRSPHDLARILMVILNGKGFVPVGTRPSELGV